MRVLYFTRDYTPHDYRFFNAMLDNGFEVYYLCPGRHVNYEVRPLPEGIHRVDWAFGVGDADILEHEAEAVEALRRVWDELKPDVIHSGPLTDTSYLAAKADLHPHCAMSWGFDLGREIHTSETRRENARFALSQADWLIGDCFVELDEAEVLGYDRSRATIFPWGIDVTRFSPGESSLREKLAATDEFLILSLRTMEPNYSVETVVRAFLRAVKQEPRMRLCLLGDGSQMSMLKEIAAGDPDGGRIAFMGRQPNDLLVDYYRSADLYVSASVVDGSSVSLLEAMGCGKAVLMSDIPGNLEWVEDRSNGMIFPVKDEKDLAEKMVYACQNSGCMAYLGEQARQCILERADWEKNKLKLKDAYEGALRRCGRC